MWLEEALQDWYAELQTLIFQPSADLHACDEQKGPNSAYTAYKHYTREELHICAQPQVAKQEESYACID